MMSHDTIIRVKLRDVVGEPIKGKRGDMSAKEAQNVLTVNSAIFQQWLARDLIPFKTIKAGKRTWRRFDVRDLPKLVLISEMLDHGFNIGQAAVAASAILDSHYTDAYNPGHVLW